MPGSTVAQDEPGNDSPAAAIRACAALESDAVKLACFEALAAGYEQRGPTPASETVPAQSDTAVTSQLPSPAGSPVASESAQAESGGSAEPGPGGAGQHPARADTPAASASAAAHGAADGIAPATQTQQRASQADAVAATPPGNTAAPASGDEAPQEPEVTIATVTRVERARGRNLLYFEFENGDVWRQMEPGFIHYPKDGPFEVHIRQGVMGEHQLRVGGEGRMTRIVRVR